VTTTNRDFKVKHGLSVAEGGTFGQAVTVGTPTQNGHAATKLYVDTLSAASTMSVGETSPATPSNGQLWFDTVTQRVQVYYNSAWSPLATLEDAELLQEHIHDTSIGGTGLIASTFKDAGFYNDPGNLVSAGLYNTITWDETWVGGIATEVYN
jgi:hypothetical protein